MDHLEYTEKQLKIINGETPMEEANGRTISWLYKKAVANNDYALAEKAKEQMRHILSVVQEQSNEEWIAIAKQMLLYKIDPSVLFVVKTHRDAIELLEEMIGQPIRKPDTWFNKQKADV